jgi:hypothetical protein
LDDDDDAYPNENASPVSTPAAEKTTFAIEKPVQETPPGSSAVSSSKSFIADGKLRNADGSIVDEKVDTPTPITSSIVAGSTAKANTGSVKASTHTILDSDKSTLNGSAANPPLFNLGKSFVPSTELSGADGQSKESTKTGPLFGLDKAAPSKETSVDAPSFNFGFNKNIDSVPQVPFTFSSSVGGESTFSKFGGASDSKLSSTSSFTAAGDVDSVPKVLESDNADAKTNIVSGFPAQSSEPSAVSTSLSTSTTNVFTSGNISSQNNGFAASSSTFSSPFLPVVTNNFTSQNMFSSTTLATSSSSLSSPATFSTA